MFNMLLFSLNPIKHNSLFVYFVPSSVWGPMKQAHIVSTILSMSSFPGVVESGSLAARCPYAMSFCKQSKAVITMRWDLL